MKKVLIIGGLAALGIYLATRKKDEADQEQGVFTGLRQLTDAEAQNYLNQNPDLAAHYNNNLQKAKEHWYTWAWENEFSKGTRQNPYLS